MNIIINSEVFSFINEQNSNELWFNGTPNDEMNFKAYTKGNQIPYGVHFTQNKDIARDFALGTTKLKDYGSGNIFVCKIDLNNIFDVSKKFHYHEEDEYYKILYDIGIKTKLEHVVFPVKDGRVYQPKYLGQEGFKNEISANRILDNTKPNIVKKILADYGINPIIKYSMISSTDPMGYNKKYSDAISVLDKNFVKVVDIEKVNN